MKRISSNISCGTTRESVPFAHKDEVTRASAKYTSKQKPSNPAEALLERTRPKKESKTPKTEPDPAGSSDPQTSYRTKNYDNTELNLQYIYRQS